MWLSWKKSTDTEHRSSGLTDVSLKDLTLSARRARIFGFNLASVEMGGHRIQASKERNWRRKYQGPLNISGLMDHPSLLSCVPVQVTWTSNKPRGKIRNALELDAMHTMQGLIIAHYASPIFSLVDSCELTNIRQSSSNWRGRRISLQIYVKGLRSKYWSGDIWNFYLSMPWNPDSFLKNASSRIV